MLSMLGGIVGDSAVQRAHREWAKAWLFKHPSPWDYMFFMNNALKRDLGWFWYYWLFTTESVDGSIQNVTTLGGRTTVTVRQDGQMPSPVVLEVKFARRLAPIRAMANAVMKDSTTAVVTWPVDVWFAGSRTFDAVLDFGSRPITRIRLDPSCRFPDRDDTDNVWPRADVPTPAPGGATPAMCAVGPGDHSGSRPREPCFRGRSHFGSTEHKHRQEARMDTMDRMPFAISPPSRRYVAFFLFLPWF